MAGCSAAKTGILEHFLYAAALHCAERALDVALPVWSNAELNAVEMANLDVGLVAAARRSLSAKFLALSAAPPGRGEQPGSRLASSFEVGVVATSRRLPAISRDGYSAMWRCVVKLTSTGG